LRFRAFLIGSSADFLFHRGAFDRFGKTLA
jgi:hypothetical protein